MILLLLGVVVVFVSMGKLTGCMGVECKNEGTVTLLFGVLLVCFFPFHSFLFVFLFSPSLFNFMFD